MKILLVEDNLVNSEVTVDMLAVINMETDVANSGQHALELFEENQYALILMDCEMPVMNGFITTEKLRVKEKHAQNQPVPIIAVTAHAIVDAKEKCIESGMNDFLSKPFDMDALHSMVHKWLDKDELNTEQYPQTVTGNNFSGSELVFDSRILDRNTLLKLFEKKTETRTSFLSKVIGIYLDQSAKLFAELDVSCKEHDVEAVRIITHTLKSSSVNVGALVLSNACRDVEISCEGGILQESIFGNLYQHYSEAKAELTGLVDYINKLN